MHFFKRGTDAIIKYLRNHLEQPSDYGSAEGNNSEEMILKSDVIKSSKVFDLR